MKNRFMLILGIVFCFSLSGVPGFGQEARQSPPATKGPLTEMKAAEAQTQTSTSKVQKSQRIPKGKKGKKVKKAPKKPTPAAKKRG